MNLWSFLDEYLKQEGQPERILEEKWLKVMEGYDRGCFWVLEGLPGSKTGLTTSDSDSVCSASEVTGKNFIFQDKRGSFQISEWPRDILRPIKYHEIREIEQMKSAWMDSKFYLILLVRSWRSKKGAERHGHGDKSTSTASVQRSQVLPGCRGSANERKGVGSTSGKFQERLLCKQRFPPWPMIFLRNGYRSLVKRSALHHDLEQLAFSRLWEETCKLIENDQFKKFPIATWNTT